MNAQGFFSLKHANQGGATGSQMGHCSWLSAIARMVRSYC